MRRLIAPAVCAVTFAMALVVWLDATGNPAAYFVSQVPPGQTLYVLSKLCALLGIVMLWLQAMATLARVTPALDGFPVFGRRGHVLFGAATFVSISSHLALFIAASTIRTGQLALDLLLPTFDHGYYRMMVGLGAIAAWSLVLAVIAGWLRLRGSRVAKWLHRCVFAAMGIGFVHGLAVGSETRFGLMKYVYIFMALSLGTAVISWCWGSARRSHVALGAPGSVLTSSATRGD